MLLWDQPKIFVFISYEKPTKKYCIQLRLDNYEREISGFTSILVWYGLELWTGNIRFRIEGSNINPGGLEEVPKAQDHHMHSGLELDNYL